MLPRVMSKWGRCSGSQRCGLSFGNEPTLVGHSLYSRGCGSSISPRTYSARLSIGCRAHPADPMLPSHRRTTNRKSWTRRWSTIASLFVSGKTRTDHRILRPATYPQDRGPRPLVANSHCCPNATQARNALKPQGGFSPVSLAGVLIGQWFFRPRPLPRARQEVAGACPHSCG